MFEDHCKVKYELVAPVEHDDGEGVAQEAHPAHRGDQGLLQDHPGQHHLLSLPALRSLT